MYDVTSCHLITSHTPMDNEYHHLDQVLPGLWVGDLLSAKDADTLKANNIQSILTLMRGKFFIPEVSMWQIYRVCTDSQFF